MAELRYRLDGASHAKTVSRWLRKDAGLEPGERREERWLVCDTFDWRLYRRGLMLVERRDPAGPVLVLSSLDDETPMRYLDDVTMPRFAADLPAGPFRARIEDIVSVRALLPLAELQAVLTPFRLLDSRHKTVLVTTLEEHRLGGADSEAGKLVSHRLRLEPLRGYERHAARVSRVLAAQRGLEPVRDDLLTEALTVRRRRPLDYDSRFQLVLSPDESADAAARRIFLVLLDALEANLHGARSHLDPEFLHDLRVAVRRTRVGLGQFGDLLGKKSIAPFADGFRRLGRITGPARDMDVYVERYDDYESSLPVDSRDALKPFLTFLLDHQQDAQELVSRQLDSKRVKKLLSEWRNFLTRQANGKRTPEARASVRQLADARIWRVYSRIRSHGRSIGKRSPAEALHDLRIRGKKLRYLMEFFRGLYPAKAIDQRISALKYLQQNLGDFQDFQVQAEALRRFAKQMTEESDVPHETILAMGRLAANLDARQQRARDEFAVRFAAFDSSRNHKRFKALFRARGKTRRKGGKS